MLLDLRWWIVMAFCSCSWCASFLNDKATLETSVRGKEQWQCNKNRYTCLHVKKHKKRYYVARDECCDILDNSNDELTETYQEFPVATVAPATPTRKHYCREEVHAVERGDVASPPVPAINRIIYTGLSDLKARAPPHTISTPSPVRDAKTNSLMQELHGLQLNFARARQSAANRVRNLKEVIADKDDCINEKDECIDVLTDCIKGKDYCIQVINNKVQAIDDQVALLQLHNIFLSKEAENKKKSDKQQTKSSLYKRLDNYVGGRGKWTRIAWELFSLSCIRNHLIDETVTHIRENVYTPTSLAYVTDMHHGLNLTGIDNMRKIDYAKKHASKLIWSSSQVTRLQRQAEIDIQEVISFNVIKETHQETNVDGVCLNMRALFEYLISSIGLSEEAYHRNVENSVTFDGATLNANSGHVTIGFEICDKKAKVPVTEK
jgi:hypothetical protein